jgi:hypothetical protein
VFDVMTVDEARRTVSVGSALGTPWLAAFTVTISVVAILSFFVSTRTAALLTLFQGGVALPLASVFERFMVREPMARDNPLRVLMVQLAMVQTVALPAVVLMYVERPEFVPSTFAAVAGGHFVPYAWLHRTRVYVVLAVALSLGGWLLVGFDNAHRWVLTWWALCIASATAMLVRRFRHEQPSASP